MTDGVVGEVEAPEAIEAVEGPGHAGQEVGGQREVGEAGGQGTEAAWAHREEARRGEGELEIEDYGENQMMSS